MTTRLRLQATTLVMGALLSAGGAWAQPAPATVHGHVQNAAGVAITSGDVKFTKDKAVEEKDQKFTNTFPIDKNGDYKGTGVTPGDYLVYVFVDGKRPDRLEVTIKAGEDRTLDFDMTRAEYIKSMSEADRAALEEYKKKAGATVEYNKVVNQLNATLKRVRDDLAAAKPTKGDVSKDVDDMKQATDAKPEEGVLWFVYADTLQAQGDHLAKADRDAHKAVSSDDAAVKLYTDALAGYKKGIDLNAASKKPAPADQAVGYNEIGNLNAKIGKNDEAAAAFENAVKLAPASAGMYYGNEAAVLFNAGASEQAGEAARKAIAADPNRPDPYYVLGQALITKATVDKAGKIVAPPGCIDAYQKYLELDPEGKFSATVKELLTSMGQTINTRYKAGKKS